MVYLIKFWREILIIALLFLAMFFINRNQDLNHKYDDVVVTHEKLILEQKVKNAEAIATVQEQRKKDAEIYANEINIINSKYADMLNRNNRMQSEIKTFTERLHTLDRKTIENYARASGVIYGECRSKYVEMGQYASQLNAELNKVTKSPD